MDPAGNCSGDYLRPFVLALVLACCGLCIPVNACAVGDCSCEDPHECVCDSSHSHVKNSEVYGELWLLPVRLRKVCCCVPVPPPYTSLVLFWRPLRRPHPFRVWRSLE